MDTASNRPPKHQPNPNIRAIASYPTRHPPWRTDRSRNIRIMVADVLEQVESGMAWEEIIEE